MSYHRLSPRRDPRRGIIAILVAVCLTVLVGFVAFALDGGILMQERRHAQATADASSLAAAAYLAEHWATDAGLDPSGGAAASALAIASANGYTNDTENSTVTVNIPPASGPFVGQAGYAEVLVTWNQQRAFSNIFGSGKIPVNARAVARARSTPLNLGLIVLDRDDRSALNFHGNGTITVNGDIWVNSGDANALSGRGSNAVLNADDSTVHVVGEEPGYTTSGGATINADSIETAAAPIDDPLRFYFPNLTADLAALPIQTRPAPIKGIYYLQPGQYVGGLSFSGSDSVSMAPGIYYMNDGGFSFNSQGNLTGNGVMIYNAPTRTSQGITITGSGKGAVTLSPMTTGDYAGVTLFQDRNADVPIRIVGNGNFNIEGLLYAANAPVSIEGNGDPAITASTICRTLDVGGNGGFFVTGSFPFPPELTINLVE